MSFISLSYFKESRGGLYIFKKFLVLCKDIKDVFRGRAVPRREKQQHNTGIYLSVLNIKTLHK